MKKSIYAAAALAVLAGCAKTETEQVPADGLTNIELLVSVNGGLGTKAVFDGDSHIKFENGDYFYGAIAKPEKPETAIYIATQPNGNASTYSTRFAITDPEAEAPTFKGNFYSIVPKDTVDTYKFYGLFPGQAVSNAAQNLTSWRVKLPSSQNPTQESWESKADAMVMKTAEVSSKGKVLTRWNEYDIADTSSVEFAHLFGFVKLDFADVPAEYAAYQVKNVVIEAVGEKQDIAGEFYVDLTKEPDNKQLKGYSTSSTITVTPQSSTTVAENTVWFVANPGTYDVKITVVTSKIDLVFERQGLSVNRSCLTSPTVHFKEADKTLTHDVALNGETWAQTSFSYSNYLNSSRKTVEWGPEGKKMAFSLSYPGSANSNYGTSYTYYNPSYAYAQGFAQNDIDGGEIHLASDAAFLGVNMVKVNLGIYSMGASCDFDICLVNKADTTVLKTIKAETDSSNLVVSGKNYYIENSTDVKDGALVIRAYHMNRTNIRPYLISLTLNPKPELVVDVEKIKLEKDAASGSFGCNVYASKAAPEVSSDADWLKVSYADGKVSYSADANEGAGRNATITIKVSDGDFSVTKTVSVSQKSAIAVEYKLSITAADMYKYLSEEAAKHESLSDYDYFDLTFNFTAVATDGSGRTMNVVMKGTHFSLTGFSENEFGIKAAKFGCQDGIGAISKVVVVANNPVATNNYANLAVKFSKDGTEYANGPQSNITTVGNSTPYTSTVTNEDEDNVFFNIDTTGGWNKVYIRSIEVTFIGA